MPGQGNIRELRNVMERAVLLSTEGTILLEHLPVERMGATVAAPGGHLGRSVGRQPVGRQPVGRRPARLDAPVAAANAPAAIATAAPIHHAAAAARHHGLYPGARPSQPFAPRDSSPSSIPPPFTEGEEELRATLRPARGRDEGERKKILWALERCAGNQTKAARLLGISRRTLVARLEEYNLPRPRKNAP